MTKVCFLLKPRMHLPCVQRLKHKPSFMANAVYAAGFRKNCLPRHSGKSSHQDPACGTLTGGVCIVI